MWGRLEARSVVEMDVVRDTVESTCCGVARLPHAAPPITPCSRYAIDPVLHLFCVPLTRDSIKYCSPASFSSMARVSAAVSTHGALTLVSRFPRDSSFQFN